jgi:ribose 5-phosphate isomerase A
MKWSGKIAKQLAWSSDISNKEKKEAVAKKIAALVRDGDVVGVGSGSTTYLALVEIGKRLQNEKLRLTAIPTSAELGITCANFGIPTASLTSARPDWSFDGADEVDPDRNLIKGRGGAMFLEKLVMKSSPKTYIIVDNSKFVQRLGEKFAVPVEVFPDAVNLVEESLQNLGATEIVLRMAKAKDGPVITETGNFILDVRFGRIEMNFEAEIKKIPGVIESGLFIGYNVEILTP